MKSTKILKNETLDFPIYVGGKEIQITVEYLITIVGIAAEGKEFNPTESEMEKIKKSAMDELQEIEQGGW